MVKCERLNYDRGWQTLFYVSENDNSGNVTASCHALNGAKNVKTLSLLEQGVHYFKYLFRKPGKYVFIIKENDVKTLIQIITVL